MRARVWCCLLAVACLPLPLALAQNTGVVTGHVYCSDTEKPARFATIRLQPAAALEVDGDRNRGNFQSNFMTQSGGGFATTGSDGLFRIADLAPGDYYADVQMPGYMQPMRVLQRNADSFSPAERERLTAQLTRVSVGPNQTVTVQVTIYRGATISGTVSYDDGGPAPGVPVQGFLLAGSSNGAATAGSGPAQSFAGFAQTDDRGQFRLTGLGDGTYVVYAAPRSIFPIYYGNTIARSEAKKIELHTGDEAPGVDIQIPAAGMHRVSGVVVSAQDNHAIARALVQLKLSSGDGSPISAVTGPDGSFVFTAVPDGRFTAQLSNAYDNAARSGYVGTGQSVEVNGGDVTDLVVTASPRN